MGRDFYCKVFVLIWSFNHGYSVPIDYCLHPLNKKDCNGKPTPVFTYYKPGSRCEIEIWRGCPTFNKFADEVLCSHYCIAKMIDGNDDKKPLPLKAQSDVIDKCKVPINQDDCGLTTLTFKYTFIDKMCIKVAWRGCESPNAFDTEEECRLSCLNWRDTLDSLPIQDVNAIAQILKAEDMTEGPTVNLTKIAVPIETESELAVTTDNVTSTSVTESTTNVTETTISEADTTTSETDITISETESTTSETETATSETQTTTGETETTTGETETTTEAVDSTSLTETVTEEETTESGVTESTTGDTESPTSETTEAVTTTTEDTPGNADEVITP